MARITASVFTSHVPAIGAALDLGKKQEPYWQPLFAGYDFSKQWMKDNTPGKWQAYSYSNPKGKAQDYIMVVRFMDKNDALMFKLRGGHQSWETH